MVTMYKYVSRVGTFFIKLVDARWHLFFEEEHLGNYAQPQQALDELAGGHTGSVSCGDTSVLGIPDELSDWTPVRH